MGGMRELASLLPRVVDHGRDRTPSPVTGSSETCRLRTKSPAHEGFGMRRARLDGSVEGELEARNPGPLCPR